MMPMSSSGLPGYSNRWLQELARSTNTGTQDTLQECSPQNYVFALNVVKKEYELRRVEIERSPYSPLGV